MRKPKSCNKCRYCHVSGYCIKNNMDVSYAIVTNHRGIFCPFGCDVDEKLSESCREIDDGSVEIHFDSTSSGLNSTYVGYKSED